MIVSLAGKGGSGKTALAALLLKAALQDPSRRVLVIDADSSMGLPFALGVKVVRTVGDVRDGIIKDPHRRKEVMDLPIKEVVAEALQPGHGFDLLVMGRGEGPGCYCGINDLLKYGIETLSEQYDLTIVDGEAGPEQVSRRVLSNVDNLLIVSDMSQRGLHTAQLIWEVASGNLLAKDARIGVVLNKVKPESAGLLDQARRMGMEVWGCVPADEELSGSDTSGAPLVGLSNACPAFVAVLELAQRIGLLPSGMAEPGSAEPQLGKLS